MAIGVNLDAKNIVNLVLRLLQFVGAIAVIVYYGRDLHAAKKEHKYSDSKWVFAVAVGSMSAISSFVLALLGVFVQYGAVAILFAWDAVLALLWVVVSGIFGSMYMKENPEMDRGIYDMKVAAGFDIANFLLWLITAVLGAWIFFVSGRRSLHTGRATK